MTIDEAIGVIHKTIYGFFDVCGDGEPMSDKDELLLAVNKAICNNIKALEQEPSGDAISRQAVLKLFATHDGKYLFEAIRDLPSVTPKQRTGRWIADVDKWGDVVTSVNGYRCSECDVLNSDIEDYCPNCGAKMESEEQA